MNDYGLKKNDVLGIFHIVDTDGAYIPDDYIFEDNQYKKAFYTTSGIKIIDRTRIIERNRKKCSILNKLIPTQYISKVPYRVFYMSCNLDHVLNNKMNSSDIEKENDSVAFAVKYRDNLLDFYKLIFNPEISKTEDYVSSWEYIKEGLHSLERYTNLGILFKDKDPYIKKAS